MPGTARGWSTPRLTWRVGDGFSALHTWLAAAETDLRAFLVGAGWDSDGAHRSLDLRGDGEVLVEQTRLGAALPER